MRNTSIRLLALALFAASPAVAQSTVTLEPSKDNSLYETTNGSLSNAKGVFLFTGRVAFTGGNRLRRALIAFDVAGKIPKGSRIVSVSLTMRMNKTPFGAPTTAHGLHRMTSDWGEGTSRATFNEGRGAASTSGDATWIHTFFSTKRWTTPGGDFVAAASATTNVGNVGPYTWASTATLVKDVQDWLDKPASNFGWIVNGDTRASRTAKRWGSRENNAANRPQLTIRFNPPKASVKSTGKGCQRNGRDLLHVATGVPSLGNNAFALNLRNGSPATVGIVFLAGGLLSTPVKLNANNCFLYLNILALGPGSAAAFNNTGQLTVPFPIPNIIGLSGVQFDTQGFAIEKDLSLRSSNALTMTIGS